MSDQSQNAECPTHNMPQTPQSDPAEGLQGGPYKQSKSTNESYTNKYLMTSRNPITGTGLNGDGVGGLKPKVAKDRAGNPLTGEGYLESDVDDFQMINKPKQVYLPNSI